MAKAVRLVGAAWLGALLAAPAAAETAPAGLGVQWEELTAPDFVRAVERSGATAVVPLGILEKHGPHLPLGTDLLDAREVALRAARKEYTIVFPAYYVGQIFEAKHQPGTMAYSSRLMWDLLQETCDEIARNGIKKIVLLNGHGGNNSFLPFFAQSQLAARRDYAVYVFRSTTDVDADPQVKALRKTAMDMHAGELETATLAAHRPDLAHLDRAGDESGADQGRLTGLEAAYTGIWWYARFPNHYAGDGRPASRALGERLLELESDQLAALLRRVKADPAVLELQKRFFDEAERPLQTKP